MTADTVTPNHTRRGQKPPRRMQIYHHPKVDGSEDLANDMARHLRGLGVEVETASIGDEAPKTRLAEQDMIAVIGGDGTMIRGGCMAAPHHVPVLGVNYGRLGFLAEVQPGEWKGVLARI